MKFLTSQSKVRVKSVSRAELKQAFAESGAGTKYEIAMAIANRFPELAPRLPRFRKPWMSEDYRMSIFDAVGFGLACFKFESQKKLAACIRFTVSNIPRVCGIRLRKGSGHVTTRQYRRATDGPAFDAF